MSKSDVQQIDANGFRKCALLDLIFFLVIGNTSNKMDKFACRLHFVTTTLEILKMGGGLTVSIERLVERVGRRRDGDDALWIMTGFDDAATSTRLDVSPPVSSFEPPSPASGSVGPLPSAAGEQPRFRGRIVERSFAAAVVLTPPWRRSRPSPRFSLAAPSSAWFPPKAWFQWTASLRPTMTTRHRGRRWRGNEGNGNRAPPRSSWRPRSASAAPKSAERRRPGTRFEETPGRETRAASWPRSPVVWRRPDGPRAAGRPSNRSGCTAGPRRRPGETHTPNGRLLRRIPKCPRAPTVRRWRTACGRRPGPRIARPSRSRPETRCLWTGRARTARWSPWGPCGRSRRSGCTGSCPPLEGQCRQRWRRSTSAERRPAASGDRCRNAGWPGNGTSCPWTQTTRIPEREARPGGPGPFGTGSCPASDAAPTASRSWPRQTTGRSYAVRLWPRRRRGWAARRGTVPSKFRRIRRAPRIRPASSGSRASLGLETRPAAGQEEWSRWGSVGGGPACCCWRRPPSRRTKDRPWRLWPRDRVPSQSRGASSFVVSILGPAFLFKWRFRMPIDEFWVEAKKWKNNYSKEKISLQTVLRNTLVHGLASSTRRPACSAF